MPETCGVKEARDKGIHTVWFHIVSVLELAELVCGDSNQSSGLPWDVRGLPGEGPRGAFWVVQCLPWVILMYAFVNSMNATLKTCDFSLNYMSVTGVC